MVEVILASFMFFRGSRQCFEGLVFEIWDSRVWGGLEFQVLGAQG